MHPQPATTAHTSPSSGATRAAIFGYFVDDKMAMGLGDKVGRGQHVCAYINANSYPNNDAYAFFETPAFDCETYAAASVKAHSSERL